MTVRTILGKLCFRFWSTSDDGIVETVGSVCPKGARWTTVRPQRDRGAARPSELETTEQACLFTKSKPLSHSVSNLFNYFLFVY